MCGTLQWEWVAGPGTLDLGFAAPPGRLAAVLATTAEGLGLEAPSDPANRREEPLNWKVYTVKYAVPASFASMT